MAKNETVKTGYAAIRECTDDGHQFFIFSEIQPLMEMARDAAKKTDAMCGSSYACGNPVVRYAKIECQVVQYED